MARLCCPSRLRWPGRWERSRLPSLDLERTCRAGDLPAPTSEQEEEIRGVEAAGPQVSGIVEQLPQALGCRLEPPTVLPVDLRLHQEQLTPGIRNQVQLNRPDVDLRQHEQPAVKEVGSPVIGEKTLEIRSTGLSSATDLLGQLVPSEPHASGCVPAEETVPRDCGLKAIVLKLAPFHLLATEGGVHVDRDHIWHMETLRRFAEADGSVVTATPYRVVDVTDPASEAEGVSWWEELTGRGGEGMVVKPLDSLARGSRGLVQPALKCRGPEYLRIIYGPEYTLPSNLERLRRRGLGAKRSLALREFALGIEGLERFVRREPLRRVHECAFAVLALESEPVDPRL